jgi:copper transport protein
MSRKSADASFARLFSGSPGSSFLASGVVLAVALLVPAPGPALAASIPAPVMSATAMFSGTDGSGTAGPGPELPPVHTELTASEPDADEAVAEPVDRVVLTYSTPVEAELSRIEVADATGNVLFSATPAHPSPGEPHRLVVRLPGSLSPGTYYVRWRTVAPDGHVLDGSYGFEVLDPAPPPDPPPTAPPAPDEAAERPVTPPSPPAVTTVPRGTAQRWLHLLATALLLGVAGFRTGVLRRLGGGEPLAKVVERGETGLLRYAAVGGVLLLVTLVTRLREQLRELGGGDVLAWDLVPHLLVRTGWGGGWFFHLAALILVVTGLFLARKPGAGSRGWSILVGGALLLPLVPAFQGHAMGSALRQVAIPVQYLHVTAMGIWLGGLLMLVLVGVPAVRKLGGSSAGLPPLARLVNGFSRIALPAVIVLVLTGVILNNLHVQDLGEMLETLWGRTLVLKLAVAALAFLLGFYNWRKVRPALATNPDPGALRIPASVEAILGVVVLLVTAALVAMPLP